MRHVLCHYHLFKNSGSTFEALLDKNFGERHIRFEGSFKFSKVSQDEFSRIIRNTEGLAYSSHQLNLPVPSSLDFNPLPAVFLRHPLLRLHSIYRFTVKDPSTADRHMPVDAANFRAWVEEAKVNRSSLQSLSNAQTRAYSCVYGRIPVGRRSDSTGAIEYDYWQAVRNLEQVPLLARTECFDEDVARFAEQLRPYGINFKTERQAPVNVTAPDFDASVDERLDNLLELLGDELYRFLETINEQDLSLYAYASRRLV
ncbi:MAG: hypothetical protein AAF098_14460 [Pseudomonadota bacterium]